MPNPENISPEFVIPACIIMGIVYFVMGSKDRREARKARLKK
jgi:hypothetical protein